MSNTLKDRIVEKSKQFLTKSKYCTITRANGSEIITISDDKIKLTKLSPQVVHKSNELSPKLTFEPLEILMNQCEQLLCLYDYKNCWLISLNKEGSLINYTTTYKIDLQLSKDEEVRQVIFNNVSEFQSEIVVLTTKEIKTYDTYQSYKIPLQRYNFNEEYENNLSQAKFDIDSSVIDPVSICFGSSITNELYEETSNSPQNALTLFLLTSDSSIYKIYPFFPNTLSVSQLWLNDLFDSTSLIFKSIKDEKEQAQLIPSVKVSALLAKSSTPNKIDIKKTLPEANWKGKISGPLPMESFPEDLYSFDAIKLISLPNDILLVIYNNMIVVFSRSTNSKMVFENQNIESGESFLLLDNIVFDTKKGRICSAMVHPVTSDSLLVTLSNGTILQVDFSQWMDSLAKGLEIGELSEFNDLCQAEHLPTEVIILGKTDLPKQENENSNGYSLRYNENYIYTAWNTREVYAMVKKAESEDILSLFLISASNEEDDPMTESNSTSNEEKEVATYKSHLTTSYQKETLPQIKLYLSKISQFVSELNEYPNRILDENNTTAEDLKSVHLLTDYVSSGQLLLLKIVSEISKRLSMMILEYRHQITVYNSVIIKKESLLNNFLKLKAAFIDASKRQEKLTGKMAKLMSDMETIEAHNNMKSISISYQEHAYFKELSRMKDYVLKKETELESIKKMLDDVKAAEIGLLIDNKSEILNNYDNVRSLNLFKKHLEAQSTFVDSLTEKLSTLNTD
ncbi:hypothetical protein DAPK24_049590 [Pichia kluyveri]|uniref:Nucleoporin Nup82 n=1 Tax=Pichia kluyveri TaxID=36015 RepID=A0AAV5R9Y4_PICKL|nr:hypothetical protein DAPK24_049590 [Pichia kluyveri]